LTQPSPEVLQIKVRFVEPGEQLRERSVGENTRTLTKIFMTFQHSWETKRWCTSADKIELGRRPMREFQLPWFGD